MQTGEGGYRTLTESEAEEVKEIWRAIGNQEIVPWDGKEWLAKIENQKREAIEKVCEMWGKQAIEKLNLQNILLRALINTIDILSKRIPKKI